MIEQYAIRVAAKLEDGVTPSLLRIIESLKLANQHMQMFKFNAREAGGAWAYYATSMSKAAKASTAFSDSVAGLSRASAILDSMAISSADLARNMRAAGGAGAGMAPPSGGGGGSHGSGGTGKRAAGFLAGSLLYGVYENAKLQDINVIAAMTAQKTGAEIAPYIAMLQQREFKDAQKYAFASGGSLKPFAGAYLEGTRLLRTLPAADQMRMMDMVMPYAAIEAKMKGIPLPEATQAFIGLAHQAGAYAPNKAYPLFESMLQASLTTHASLGQIARAASYALPALNAAGANASDVMMLIATMQQAGIMNTKSGTWLNNLALNALPNTLGSGLFKNKQQNEALHRLGLYVGNRSLFYKNGRMDLKEEVAILAADRLKMKPEEFNAATRLAFGIQGQRGASLFSEGYVQNNLNSLAALRNIAPAPIDVAKMIKMFSTVAKADQTIANANMTIMKGTAVLTPSVNWALDKTASTFSFMAQHRVVGIPGLVLNPAANWGLDKTASILSFMERHDVAGGFGLMGHGLIEAIKSLEIKVNAYIDGKDVAHHVVNNIGSKPATGASGLNQQKSPLRPSLNGAPGL